MLFQDRIKPRIVCNFNSKDDNLLKGYGVGVFITQKDYTKEEYLSKIIKSINLLGIEDATNLIIEDVNSLNIEEINELERSCKLKVLTGRNIASKYIPYVLKEIYKLRNQRLNEKEILIISDDTYLTENAALDIAKNSNYLTILSKDINFSKNLRMELLQKTGLSLQLMTNLDRKINRFDVIVNLAANAQFNIGDVKIRSLIIDLGIGRRFAAMCNNRKDLLIITDLLFRNNGIIKSNPNVFNFKDKIASHVYQGIKGQDNLKPIEVSINNRGYKIRDAVELYYGNKRNRSLFITK